MLVKEHLPHSYVLCLSMHAHILVWLWMEAGTGAYIQRYLPIATQISSPFTSSFVNAQGKIIPKSLSAYALTQLDSTLGKILFVCDL